MKSIDEISKDLILKKSKPVSNVLSGVYFLINDDEIVYVGQSVDVGARIGTHRKSGRKFNKYTVLSCREELMSDIEAHFICTLKPKYNKTVPKNDRYFTLKHLTKELPRGYGKSRVLNMIIDHSIKPVYGFNSVGWDGSEGRQDYYDLNIFLEIIEGEMKDGETA